MTWLCWEGSGVFFAMAPTVGPPWSFGWVVVLLWFGVGVKLGAEGVGVVVCHCVMHHSFFS